MDSSREMPGADPEAAAGFKRVRESPGEPSAKRQKAQPNGEAVAELADREVAPK